MRDPPRIDTADLIHAFEAVADLAMAGPVMITREDGDPLILLCAEDYARLKRRDRQVWAVEDLPDAWRAAIARSPE